MISCISILLFFRCTNACFLIMLLLSTQRGTNSSGNLNANFSLFFSRFDDSDLGEPTKSDSSSKCSLLAFSFLSNWNRLCPPWLDTQQCHLPVWTFICSFGLWWCMKGDHQTYSFSFFTGLPLLPITLFSRFIIFIYQFYKFLNVYYSVCLTSVSFKYQHRIVNTTIFFGLL